MRAKRARVQQRRWPLVVMTVVICAALTAAAALVLVGTAARMLERTSRIDAHHLVTAIQLHNMAQEQQVALTDDAEALYQSLGGEEALGLSMWRFERALPFVQQDETGEVRFHEPDAAHE